MDLERLIIEVEKHPIIYDPSHRYYKDNLKKEKTWNTIATVLGVDANLCKNKWRTVRDAYVRNRKKSLASGSARAAQREWRYKDILSFLEPHLYQRSSKSNLRALLNEDKWSMPLSHCGSEEDRPCGSASVLQDTQPLPASPLSSPSEPTPSGDRDMDRDRPRSRSRSQSCSPREWTSAAPTETPTIPRRSRPEPTDVEERRLAILQAQSKPESAVDECYHFSLSIAPLLLKMDHSTRQQTKIAIMKTIISMENSMVQPQPPPPT